MAAGKRERGRSNRLRLSACSAETESVQGRQAPSRGHLTLLAGRLLTTAVEALVFSEELAVPHRGSWLLTKPAVPWPLRND